MSIKLPLSACAALAALGFAASVHAQPLGSVYDPYTVSVKVPVGDLNLDSQAGATAVIRRIAVAARLICGDESDDKILSRRNIYRACLRDVIDRGVAQLNNPTVDALNKTDGRTGAIVVSSR